MLGLSIFGLRNELSLYGVLVVIVKALHAVNIEKKFALRKVWFTSLDSRARDVLRLIIPWFCSILTMVISFNQS